MRVAVGTYKPVTDAFLRRASQLGVKDVLFTPHRHEGFDSVMPLGETWSSEVLEDLIDRLDDHGLRLFAFEKMPVPLYEILLEQDDEARAEKMDIIKQTIRNMGEAGIPVLGYSGHPPDGAVRTTRTKAVRGGAQVSAFDIDDLENERLINRDVTEEELWAEYEAFLDEVVPVAEEAGVTLGVHPSDPPLPEINGIPLLFRNFENFKRAMSLVDSENHGLKFCLGCWSEMGEDVVEVIRHFGGEDIVYVHFRDVVGSVPRFYETFIDDPESNYDEYEVMKTLYEEGFTGVMTPDHVPLMEGEDEWEFGGSQGRTYTVGYLNGMLKAVTYEGQNAE
ncbi:TIM barrel protein [Halorubrum sp. CBA1125]|nr:TIM barrel protein [Halorubrum sp. CBA1125]